MIINSNINDLIKENIDISHYGYKKLTTMYLEYKSLEERKYIYYNITKINKINIDDIFEVVTFCSLYNRSYRQIEFSDDIKLQSSDYLNTIHILVNVFKELTSKYNPNAEYIFEIDDELDYIDLIVIYFKEIHDEELFYKKMYEMFEVIVWNDLTVFYKLIYTFLTNTYFNSLKYKAIYEVFHLKDMLFEYLLKSNNNIDQIIKVVNDAFTYVPTISISSNLINLIDLVDIRSVCCDRSLTFYADGYKMMSFFNSNKVFDYSSVSLQFFKVIEIELKEKIINYCSNDLDEEELYKGITESDNLEKFKFDFLDRLELGKIRYILRNVKSLMYDVRNENEISYYNETVEIFYKRLTSLFMNVSTINFYLGILHNNCVNLYRNSSVHTGILSYERANEASIITKLFLKELKKLNYSFDMRNVANASEAELPSFVKELMLK